MDYLKGYEAYLTTEKKASENTLSSYLRDVRQFSEYCQRETLELTETTTGDVERYAKYLMSRGKSVSTVTRAVASLKSFLGICIGRDISTPIRPAEWLPPRSSESSRRF